MTIRLTFRTMGLAVAVASLASAALAADGLKATFTATRKLPVDQITVIFSQTEVITPHEAADRPDAGDKLDAGRVMIDAFRAAGLRVVDYRAILADMQPAANTAMFNKVSPGSKAPAGYELRRSYLFTLTGFNEPETIIHILARNGIRQAQAFRLEHSNVEAVRSELAEEAIDSALLKARALAKRLGIAETDIVDVTAYSAGSINFTSSNGFGASTAFGSRLNDFGGIQLVDSAVELSGLDTTEAVVRVKVSATVTLSPRRSAP